jgi:hypothetical protein
VSERDGKRLTIVYRFGGSSIAPALVSLRIA